MKGRGKTSNVERRTSNVEVQHSAFESPLRRSAFDVRRSAFSAAGMLCLIAALTLLFAASASAAPTLTRQSSPVFYTDFGKNLSCMYVAYQVTNDGVSRPNMWATIGSFTGGSVSLAPSENGIVSLGSFAPGQSKLACFYLQASSLSAGAQGHTITVLDNVPGIGATLATGNFAFTSVADTIAASANKVTTTVATPNPPSVGGIVTITVTGHTGTIGAAKVLAFSPATYSNWRADALQLVTTSITFSGGNTGTYNDTLLVPPAGLGSSDTDYTSVFNFRIVNTTGTSVPVSPIGYISSGTQIKHTDTGNFLSLLPILPAINTTLLAKTVTPTALATGGIATYKVRLSNSGIYDVQLDRIVDVLPSSPANATYIAGSSTFNGVAIPDPNITVQTLTYGGTFVVPAGTFRDLVYRVTIPNIGGSYVNRATAYIEDTRIDTTQSTSDDAPGQATVTVPSADVVTTKTGPATSSVGATFDYTVTYKNNGPDTARNLVVKDTLPAQVTFLSATGGGTQAGGIVTWNVGDVVNGATASFTVTVSANATGSAVNVAASTSDSFDPALANNDGSAAGAKVTTTIGISSDVAVTKTGPTAVAVGVPFDYTITATNNGPSTATGVVVKDTLPAALTFGSASGGGTFAAGVVTWPTIASLASGSSASFTVTVTAAAAATFTNIASSTSTTADPTPANNNGSAAASRVTTTATNGMPLSGFVYSDANGNLQQDSGEAGTGLTLFVKLVDLATPGGPALQATTVDPVTGAYLFSAVPAGNYSLVLDDNATLADVTPALPAGWTGTESGTGVRSPVAMTNIPLSGQNFGLINALGIRGTVFSDIGTTGGTANDGVLNGGETGIAGATLKLTNAAGTTTFSTTTSDASGNYSLFIPGTIPAGTALKIVETNVVNFLSTGGTAGNTGGSYGRATDTVSFNLTLNTTYANVNFADVPANTLTTDGQQSGLPGTVLYYPHTFTAGSAGTVTFSTASVPNPALAGWSALVFRDVNGNGQFDSGEPQITAPIAVVAGDTIALLVKEFIPVNASFGAKDQETLSASFNYVGAAPVLTSTITRQDVTTVGNPTTAGLTLVKSVDKATALPGQTLTYTIAYSNNSSAALSNIVIFDTTPAFSTFVSTANGPLPPGLTGPTVIAPAAGATGAIRWTFTGTLAPAGAGTVSFTITIDQ